MIWLMRVTEAHDVSVRLLHDPEQAFFIPVLKKIFIDLPGTTVHQQKVQLIMVQLEFNLDMRRQRTQVPSFVILHNPVGEGNGDSAVGLFNIRLVSAATIVASTADPKII